MFKHNRPWLAVLLVAVALLCACAPAAQTSPSPIPATDATESPADSPAESPEQSPAAQEESFAVLTDVLGREVVLAERPATIVSLDADQHRDRLRPRAVRSAGGRGCL